MSERAVIVLPDADSVAQAAAQRLVSFLLERLALTDQVHVAVTGGTVGIATLAAVASNDLALAIDWPSVHLWWGDERFLPQGDPDRNDKQAGDALLSREPFSHARIHPMPAATGGEVSETDARAYARELSSSVSVEDPSGVPSLDLVLLGIGPDGHVASLFPGHAASLESTDLVVIERDSPKSPPQRISLTYPVLNAAGEVWMLAAGKPKAEAVSRALHGDDPSATPAAGVSGRMKTLWLIDAEAASA